MWAPARSAHRIYHGTKIAIKSLTYYVLAQRVLSLLLEFLRCIRRNGITSRVDIHIPAREGRICFGLSSDGDTCGCVCTREQRARDLQRDENRSPVLDVLHHSMDGAIDPTRVCPLLKMEMECKQVWHPHTRTGKTHMFWVVLWRSNVRLCGPLRGACARFTTQCTCL